MSFDDGMQFVKVSPRTEVLYVVAAVNKYGSLAFPGGQTTSLDEAKRLLEKAEVKAAAEPWIAESNQHIRVWLPEHKFMDDSITLEEYQPAQEAEAVSEEIPAEEQSEKAAQTSSTDEQPQIAASGKFEVFVQPAGSPEYVLYRGNSRKDAQAAVASMVGKCNRVYTRFRGTLMRDFASHKLGLYWDAHEQYVKDWNTGAFDEAFLRDAMNEEAIRPEYVRQHEASYIARKP